MTLPSPVGLSGMDIEIEDAHTPVPPGGFPGGSPTGEIHGTPGRIQRGERKHSARCFVTLKRKGSRDVVRKTHARSVSTGSVDSTCCGCGGAGGNSSNGSNVGGSTPKMELGCSEFFKDMGSSSGGSHRRQGSGTGRQLFPAVGPPPTPPLQRAGGGGSFRAGDDGGGGGGPAVASLEDAAQRIAVDPDSGRSYFVDRSTVCDACGYCDDTCEVAWCNGCDERRLNLEDAYGPIMLSALEGGAAAGTGLADGGGSKLAPVLARRYPRKSSYTLCEVRRRKVTGACWIVSQGSVYDVTAALADHPGGKRSVLRNAGGRDCAEDFFFHSKAAKKEWRQYRIGSLVACRGEEAAGGGGSDGEGAERSMRTGSDCVIS
ncbi:unnamed protein product [Scytosiphon promiscuus]